MDDHLFDRWTVAIARRSSRRTLSLLIIGSLGGMLSRHAAAVARAAQVEVADPPSADSLCAVQGLDNCGGTCVDISADPANCGACGWVCESSQTCSGGMCWAPSPSTDQLCAAQGLTNCGGVCTNLAADPYNCGTCGRGCGAGDACVDGACLAPAPSSDQVCAAQGLTNCGGVCTNTLGDSANCGACGNSCPLGGYCQGGVCVGLVCLDGLTDCYGSCVDLSSDWSHCGGCELGCFDGYTCVNGQCVD
jgi:hypothetical protein